jgi:hypothetical protein
MEIWKVETDRWTVLWWMIFPPPINSRRSFALYVAITMKRRSAALSQRCRENMFQLLRPLLSSSPRKPFDVKRCRTGIIRAKLSLREFQVRYEGICLQLISRGFENGMLLFSNNI